MSLGQLTVAVVMLGTLVACGSDGSDTSRHPGSPPASANSTRDVATTAQMDAIAVLGHSGATGTMSDPQDPSRDATENSWATGENPHVRSVYQRLVERYPAIPEVRAQEVAMHDTGEELHLLEGIGAE